MSRQPGLATVQRYNAACSAPLAGPGRGKDSAALDGSARAELRYMALSWLQEELSFRASQLSGRQPGGAEQVRRTLRHWKTDIDLSGVRDPASIRILPESEQVSYLNLWAHIDAILIHD